MASLPQGWESDYDGSRWFFVYRPTGQIQYQFPKPGDEFPDFIDSFAPAPVLLPEEKLESQQQVKRRSTTGSSSRSRAAGQRQREASALPVVDDEGGFEYSFESFGYLGPSSYNDVSPLNDDEEEEDKGPGRSDKLKEGAGKDSPANMSTPGERPRVSPMTSAGTTPQVGKTEPASGTPIMGEPVMGESATVHTIIEEPVMSEPIMSDPVLGVATEGAPAPGSIQGAQSPTVHMLDGTEVSPPPAPAFSPVGFMPELYSESTAQCNEETNPPPVELPDNAIWVEPIQTVGFVNDHPVELPTHHSPVEQRPQEPPVVLPPSQQQIQSQQVQYPYGISASFASVSPPPQAGASPPVAESAQKPGNTGPQAGNYQPWKPSAQEGDESTRRGSVILGNMSIAESQRNELGPLDNRRSPGAPTPPPKIDPSTVPAVLSPPNVPANRPTGQDEAEISQKSNVQASDSVHPLMPGAGARHASISNSSAQPPGLVGLSHVPSVLKPGPRQSLDRTGGFAPSNQSFQPQQKPYLAYQPTHPMLPGVPPVSYAQLVQPRQYQAMPPGNFYPGPLEPGTGQPSTLETRPAVPRTNTVPNQLPSQVPPPIVTPPPASGPDTQEYIGQDGSSQGPSLDIHQMSTGNIHISPSQVPIVQREPSIVQLTDASFPTTGPRASNSDAGNASERRPIDGQASTLGQRHASQSSVAHDQDINAAGSNQTAEQPQGPRLHGSPLAPHVSTAQGFSSPQQFVSEGSILDKGHESAIGVQGAGSPQHSNTKLQEGNSANQVPQTSFVMDQSIVVQGPVIQPDKPRESQVSETVEVRSQGESAPVANQATPVKLVADSMIENARTSIEQARAQGQQPQASQVSETGPGKTGTTTVNSIAEDSGALSAGSSTAGGGLVLPPSQQIAAPSLALSKPGVQTPESASSAIQPQSERTAQDKPVAVVQSSNSQGTAEFRGQTGGLQGPSVASQASGQGQPGPEVSVESTDRPVMHNQAPPTQSSSRPQNTQVGQMRQSSQHVQQASGQQPTLWQQTPQLPQQYLNANSPVGPWSVANLPGMAVLQQNSYIRPQGQQVQAASALAQQPPPAQQSQTPAPSVGLSRPQIQNTAPRNDQNNVHQPSGHIQSSRLPVNVLPTAPSQSFQVQGENLAPQTQPRVTSHLTAAPAKDGQILSPASTPVVLPQQQNVLARPAGQQAQQPRPGQQPPASGVVQGQNHPQAMSATRQSQLQQQPPSQPHQGTVISNQFTTGQQSSQQPQNPAEVSSQGPLRHSQQLTQGINFSGPLPLQTASSQQSGQPGPQPVRQPGSQSGPQPGPSSGNAVSVPGTGSSPAGPPSAVNIQPTHPAQPGPGQPSRPHPQNGPGFPGPNSLPGAVNRPPHTLTNQDQPGRPSQQVSTPSSLPGQKIQVQDFPRQPPMPQAGTPASSNLPSVGNIAQAQPQIPSGYQGLTGPFGPAQPGASGSNQFTGQPTSSVQTLPAPYQMQSMPPNRGALVPPVPGQIPYNPRMFPPMPPPLVTQPSNAQQPGWGQPGTPTHSGPQSPSSQRRLSQQSVAPTTPSSRRASGYQIQPGTQSPVVPQQIQFPPSQSAQPATGAPGKEKNWFSKMWKNPSSKKGSTSGGAAPTSTVGMNAAPGNVPGPNMYDPTRPEPSKLQKPQLQPVPQIGQQPQGFPMVYNGQPQLMPNMQGLPGPYRQPVSNNPSQQPVSGMPQPYYQNALAQPQNPISSHQRNPSQPVFAPGTPGQIQQIPHGGHWQQQQQGGIHQGVNQGMPTGHPSQQMPSPGQAMQQQMQKQPAQAPSNQAPRGSQGVPTQFYPMHQHQHQPPHQGMAMGASSGTMNANVAPPQNLGSQPHMQPPGSQVVYQSSVPPPLPQQQQPPQQQGSGEKAVAAAAVGGAVGSVASASAPNNSVDDSCVVAPLFSSSSQHSVMSASADGSTAGDSGYAIVDAHDTVSIDVETTSVVGPNGNAWTTTSIDYEGNDWGETW